MCARVAAAMSGGVDSCTAAWLLKQAGHRPEGITMELFGRGADSAGEEAVRRSAADVEAARDAARRLGIPHHVFRCASVFREQVMDPFAAAYEAGRTPNPCVLCNRCLKFGALLRQAEKLGLEKIATGHYVRLDHDAGAGRFLLRKAVHGEKDQSYVLCTLTQDQLARSLFPLGELSKGEVREIAREQGFVSAHRADSQDICFVPDGDYAAFIRRHTGKDYPPGPFLDEAGRALGRHAGIIGYTVGQRRGLGVSSSRGRLYVREVRPADNAVVLGPEESLYARTLTASGLNLIPCARLDAPLRLRAKVRYRMTEQPCTVEQTGPDRVRVTFDQPQRAITPGQTVAFYDGDVLVGGAEITSAC